jgi:hypothetical protein
MYPLKSIVDFLLSGISRIPAEGRADALCSMFAGLLPDMCESDIAMAREQVIARFWDSPETADAVVNLIDGHMVLRMLFPDSASGEATETSDDTDYEV